MSSMDVLTTSGPVRLRAKAWPAVQVAALIELMKSGATSGQATKALRLRFGAAVTRSSVIGFAWRNGWAWRKPDQKFAQVWPAARQNLTLEDRRRREYANRRERWHKVCVDVNHDTWDDLTDFAQRHGISRCEAIRTLLVWGLDGEKT